MKCSHLWAILKHLSKDPLTWDTWHISRLFSRGYFVCLNLSLMLIGILRPVWLFHDPYNDEKSWPRVAAYLLVDTGLPAITTAFAVLFLALLRYVCTTQLPNFIMNAKLCKKAKLQSAKVLAMPWERNHCAGFIFHFNQVLEGGIWKNVNFFLPQSRRLMSRSRSHNESILEWNLAMPRKRWSSRILSIFDEDRPKLASLKNHIPS